jgi:uroporphyrinogen-III synthase
LTAYGIHSAIVPANASNTEAVLEMPEFQLLNNKNCLIIRGVGGRELLANTLRSRGAFVDYLELYQRVLPTPKGSSLIKSYMLNNVFAAIFIYSTDALRHLMKILAKDNIKKNLLAIPLIVISDRVSVVAEQVGFKKIIVANEASDQAMINALLNGEECGRSN